MTDHCDALHAYVDGELGSDELIAFEAHLAGCDACAKELPRLLALMSALDAAGAAAAAPRLTLISGGGELEPPRGLPDQPRNTDLPVAPPLRRRRRTRWIAAGLTSLLAAAAALLVLLPRRSAPTAPTVASLESELGPTRALEARLSYPGTERYRPLGVVRGASNDLQSHEPISIDQMSRLEHAKDWHGVAVASLLAGERERALRFFAQAPSTPQVNSDRAALELLDGGPEALERALDDVDRALAAAPNQASALWNRALVLARLDLPLAAARDFDRVAALGEPGWADDARTRAAVLRAAVLQRRTRWTDANEAGRRLIENGTPIPADLTGVTGHMTLRLYDAVRAAPSRDRVEALLPLAGVLDSAYHTDRLTSYVRRIAASDFRIRKPLADGYRELILHAPLPDAAVDALIARLGKAASDDIWMGAVVRAGRVGAHLESYLRLAAATQDPWFAAIAEQETARAEIARGDRVAAERRLRDALGAARRERLVYRTLALEEMLGALLRDTRRPSQAAAEAQAEYRDAITGGEWPNEMNALTDLAAANQVRYANGLARAELTELLARADSSALVGGSLIGEQYDCAWRQYAYQSLANISLLLLDQERTRNELSSALECKAESTTPGEVALHRTLMLTNATIWTELHRLSHRDDDARLARARLDARQADPQTSTEERAFLAYFDGNLLIDVDRLAGRRRLRDAIAQAGHRTDDLSIKARTHSFSLLAVDSGQASEFADVIALLAETLDVPRPQRCAVAIAVEAERSVVAFSDARGETGGQFIAHRGPADLDVSTLVPSSIVGRLRTCERVAVLARAPVLGAGGLLPPDLAWSYMLKGPATSSASPTASGRRLVVANPANPAELRLPPLSPYPVEPNDGDLLVLRGPEATPTRVLQAMRDASVIEFHTHGFIANDVSEASYLVMSPDLDQQYRLTASEVAQVKLGATPLVILGACHAAASSRSLEGGTGLAEAFLRSGARAVVASPDAVQDITARGFFTAVREQVVRGTDPVIAVRNERVRRLTASHDDSWVARVVVFE